MRQYITAQSAIGSQNAPVVILSWYTTEALIDLSAITVDWKNHPNPLVPLAAAMSSKFLVMEQRD